MIGYEMGYSLAGVYTMAKASPVKNFINSWEKNDMVVNMATLCVRGVLQRSSFSGNLKSSYKRLGL